jgi:hypothetical protein
MAVFFFLAWASTQELLNWLTKSKRLVVLLRVFGILWQSELPTQCSIQGCQIFLDTIYQNGGKYHFATKLLNGYNMYQMAVIYSKCPKNITAFSITRPSNSYPNCNFWFENMPSGNPGSISHSYLVLTTAWVFAEINFCQLLSYFNFTMKNSASAEIKKVETPFKSFSHFVQVHQKWSVSRFFLPG